jgi:hypothetical protein
MVKKNKKKILPKKTKYLQNDRVRENPKKINPKDLQCLQTSSIFVLHEHTQSLGSFYLLFLFY